jgi:hypothetical protein
VGIVVVGQKNVFTYVPQLYSLNVLNKCVQQLDRLLRDAVCEKQFRV